MNDEPADPRPVHADASGAADRSAPAGVAARLWSLRTVIAAAVTAVALSGVGGAALAAAGNGGSDQGGRPARGGFGGPPGVSGQLPGQGRPGQQPGTPGT